MPNGFEKFQQHPKRGYFIGQLTGCVCCHEFRCHIFRAVFMAFQSFFQRGRYPGGSRSGQFFLLRLQKDKSFLQGAADGGQRT